MTDKTQLTRHAGVAIAAALAFGPTPLLAQVPPDLMPAPAEPVLVIPQSPPPAAQPAPTIVLPTELPDEAPATEAEPAPPVRAATAPPARQRVTAPAAAPAAPPADIAPAAVEEPMPLTDAAIEADVAEPFAPLATAEEPAGETFAEPVDGFSAALLVLLGGLLAIGLAIWGFVAIGRRKTVDRKAAAIVERPRVTPRAPQPEPIAARPIAPEPVAAQPIMHEPIAAEPMPAPALAPTRIDRASPAPSMAHSGASIPLPRTIPETFEERDALMKRMIAARPDRANPFTSPIQRYHRAKLILQSIGRDFGDVEPWIDLSQYPANWPELARRRNAAA